VQRRHDVRKRSRLRRRPPTLASTPVLTTTTTLQLLLAVLLGCCCCCFFVDAERPKNKQPVKVCHRWPDGRQQIFFFPRKRGILRKHRNENAPDRIWTCNPRIRRVPVCHYSKRDDEYRNLSLSQFEAWRHIIWHSEDYLGICDPKETEDDTNLKGKGFGVSADLNDPRLLWSTLKSRYDDSKGDESRITWYGSRDLDFEVDDVKYAAVERGPDHYLVFVDSQDRPNLFVSTKDSFHMKVQYRSRNRANFIIDLDGTTRPAFNVELDPIIGRRQRRNRRLRKQQQQERRRRAAAAAGKEGRAHLRSGKNRVERRQGHRRLKQTSRKVNVALSGCTASDNDKYDDNLIRLEYTVSQGNEDKVGTVWGTFLGDGLYEFLVPVQGEGDGDGAAEVLKDACREAVGPVNATCDAFDDALGLRDVTDREEICDAIVDKLNVGTALGDTIRQACEDSFEAAYQTCAVLEGISNELDEDLDEEVCENLVPLLESEREFQATKWKLKAQIAYPFELKDRVSEQDAKTDIPPERDSYEFAAVGLGDNPAIESFVASPANPRPNQGYTLTATVSCANPDRDVIQLWYEGSDGFGDTKFCETIVNSNNDATICTLTVGGASAGTRDVCTVWIGPDGISESIEVVH